ncbi:fasciclin domain-containing protein [Mucilaginibacter mali]|uniref:Fasciclin domain-containing protein n=1 Tax=Mucilaginibacter mali TaxID=2740462 RepID=A0A7D4PXP6_9SPHI|nr:fasciclin domain-containing protein [Mucilaginibacter mali]QKJ32623.1 fasciclin domain-containing protein [Mucilaginibacter mali]
MKKSITKILAIMILPCLLGLAGCKKISSYDYPPSTATPYVLISNDNNFSTFKGIVDRAGLADLLNSNDAYTVFAPNNTAFSSVGYTATYINSMTNADLAILVKNHIVQGKIDVKATTSPLTTLSGRKINVQKGGSTYYLDGGDILNTNLATTGGYLNTINRMIYDKPTILDVINTYNVGVTTVAAQLTYLAAAITRASTGSTNFTALFSGTDAYTLFAPTNDAFNNAGYASVAAVQAAAPDVLGNLLKYQMIQGTKLTSTFDSVAVKAYNGTNIYFDVTQNANKVTSWFANGINFSTTGGNLTANNGVLHVVGRFFPAPVTTNTLDRITSDATLTMFAALIARASTADPKFNYTNMLSGNSSYTVFAVNNTGLIAAGYANVAAINAESPTVLAAILKLHIVPKRVNNISIAEGGTVASLSGTNLTINTSGGYKVKGPSNAASITVATGNVVTTNGILNIIGSILTP